MVRAKSTVKSKPGKRGKAQRVGALGKSRVRRNRGLQGIVHDENKPRTYVGSTPRGMPKRLAEHNSPYNRTKKTRGRLWECVATTSVIARGPSWLGPGRMNPSKAMSLARSVEWHVQRNYLTRGKGVRVRAYPPTRSIVSRFQDVVRTAAIPKFAKHNIQLIPTPKYAHLMPRSA